MSILMGTWGYVLGVSWNFLRNMVADWQTELAGANGREHFLDRLEYLESLLIGRTIGSDLELNTPGFDQHRKFQKKCVSCSRGKFFKISLCDGFSGRFPVLVKWNRSPGKAGREIPSFEGLESFSWLTCRKYTGFVQSLLDGTILWWIGWSRVKF